MDERRGVALMMPSWFILLRVPTSLRIAMRLIPTHYMVEALTLALAAEASPGRIWIDTAALALSMGVVFAAVVWRLRRLQHGVS